VIDRDYDAKFTAAWKKHADAYPAEAPPEVADSNSKKRKRVPKKKINYDHLKKAKIGVFEISYCLERAVHRSTILESFEKTGIKDPQTNKPNYEIILNNCKCSISDEDRLEIMKKLPQLSAMMKTTGYLLDSNFNGISACNNKPTRDHLQAVSRKGYTFMTGPLVVPEVGPEAIVEQVAADTVLMVVENRTLRVKRTK
jgi:hypothetical protein